MHITAVGRLGVLKPTVERGSEVYYKSLYSKNSETLYSL